jgi:hypothetical protein
MQAILTGGRWRSNLNDRVFGPALVAPECPHKQAISAVAALIASSDYARARRLLTDFAYHCPPRGVLMQTNHVLLV